MNLTDPLHCTQVSTSMLNSLFKRCAQVIARRFSSCRLFPEIQQEIQGQVYNLGLTSNTYPKVKTPTLGIYRRALSRHLPIFAEGIERFNWLCYAYCLMGVRPYPFSVSFIQPRKGPEPVNQRTHLHYIFPPYRFLFSNPVDIRAIYDFDLN